jgi:ribose transport system substrate-binding protein
MAQVIAGRGRRIAFGAATVLTALVVALYVAHSASARPSAHKAGNYVLGVSNTLLGNGWREEMICAVKAEAAASGQVSKVVISDINNGNAAQQIAGMRNLISAGANAIIVNPSSNTALNGVIAQAAARHIVTVAVDQSVTASQAYQASNDQVAYGRLGMEWLAKQLHGHGNVVVMRGIAGVPADTDRETGIKQALKKYPGIHVIKEVYTNWQFAPGGKAMLDILNSGQKVDGVWTSGIDYTVVNAFKTVHKPYVPVVGADNNEFLHQILTLKKQGFVGAAVTNPATIGGVGASIALSVLNGHPPANKVIKLKPQVWDYKTSLATIKANYSPKRPATYSARLTVKPYTHYTPQQLTSCKGP